MNGELANAIALGLHGSAWLASPQGEAPALERSNSTFGYVDTVEFITTDALDGTASPAGTTSGVSGTETWLEALRAHGVGRLWLVLSTPERGALPPHVASAFAGNAHWGLLADGDRPTVWVPAWSYANPHHPEQRVWNVRYNGHAVDSSFMPSAPDVTTAADTLRRNLVVAANFARANSLAEWALWFDDALDQSEASAPEIAYHLDIAPRAAVSTDAFRLLAMAVRAWVFGGMGSWNDVWIEDPAAASRYEEISRNLYAAILEACVAATNAELTGFTRGT